jgi:hypothetical protein
MRVLDLLAVSAARDQRHCPWRAPRLWTRTWLCRGMGETPLLLSGMLMWQIRHVAGGFAHSLFVVGTRNKITLLTRRSGRGNNFSLTAL